MARRVRDLGGRAEVLPQELTHGEINAQLGLESAYTRAVEAFMASLDAVVAQPAAVPKPRLRVRLASSNRLVAKKRIIGEISGSCLPGGHPAPERRRVRAVRISPYV